LPIDAIEGSTFRIDTKASRNRRSSRIFRLIALDDLLLWEFFQIGLFEVDAFPSIMR